MERNIKADTWSSLQAKNLGFFLGILLDLLGLSDAYHKMTIFFHLL
jgi:hypothetical protein